MPWWTIKTDTEEKPKKEEDQEIELKPGDVKAKLDQIDTLKTSVDEIKGKTAILDRMSSYLDEVEAAKRSARATEMAKKASETSEELDELWLSDPKAAALKQFSPLIEAQTNTNSQLLRAKIFSDESKYPYYHGDLAREVDSLIDNLPINYRADPNTITNCYNTALGKHMQEIQEGKIKTKFANSSQNSTSTPTNVDTEKEIVLTADQKRAARAFGLDEKTYAEQWRKEQSYV